MVGCDPSMHSLSLFIGKMYTGAEDPQILQEGKLTDIVGVPTSKVGPALS